MTKESDNMDRKTYDAWVRLQKEVNIREPMLPAAVGHRIEPHRVVNMRWQYPKEERR
jgi:hypothetical protein